MRSISARRALSTISFASLPSPWTCRLTLNQRFPDGPQTAKFLRASRVLNASSPFLAGQNLHPAEPISQWILVVLPRRSDYSSSDALPFLRTTISVARRKNPKMLPATSQGKPPIPSPRCARAAPPADRLLTSAYCLLPTAYFPQQHPTTLSVARRKQTQNSSRNFPRKTPNPRTRLRKILRCGYGKD